MPSGIAAKLRSAKNVELLGQVADSGNFMDRCAVLALPVHVRGGVPLKVIEAMARGKAVVASPEAVFGLATADGADMLVRSDPDQFATAIASLLQNVAFRRQLGDHARATFERDFSLSSTERVLRRNSVLSNHGASNHDRLASETACR